MADKKDDGDQTQEALKEARQFMRQVDEAQELFDRARDVFPLDSLSGVRKHQADLEQRFKAGDKRVIATHNEDGKVIDYSLRLAPDEEKRLIDRYIKERTDRGQYCVPEDNLKGQAELFVRIIAGHGCVMPVSEAIIPPNQKERKRNLDSVANAFDKLVDSLNKLDSAALGWMFAVMEDSAAKSGLSIRPPGPGVPSLKSRPMQAMVEAGEVRKVIKRISEAVGPAIREAGKSLPKVEREENDPRLHASFFLERQLQENGMPFEVTETSFTAECLRTIFDLGGYDTDRVSYWLKKVADTPDHEVPWFGAIRKTTG